MTLSPPREVGCWVMKIWRRVRGRVLQWGVVIRHDTRGGVENQETMLISRADESHVRAEAMVIVDLNRWQWQIFVSTPGFKYTLLTFSSRAMTAWTRAAERYRSCYRQL